MADVTVTVDTPDIAVTVTQPTVEVSAVQPVLAVTVPGPPGPPGPAGVGVEQFIWNYDTSATMADPGSGRLRTNTPAGTAATLIALSAWPLSGVDIGNMLRSLTAGDLLFFQEADDSHNWGRYELTGPPVDNGTWFQVPVYGIGTAGGTINKNQGLLIRFTYGTPGATVVVSTTPPTDHTVVWVDAN